MVTPEQLYAEYKGILGDAIANYPWEFFVEAAKGIDTIPKNVSIIDLEKIIQEFAALQRISPERVRLGLYSNVFSQMVLYKIQKKNL